MLPEQAQIRRCYSYFPLNIQIGWVSSHDDTTVNWTVHPIVYMSLRNYSNFAWGIGASTEIRIQILCIARACLW